MHGALGFCVTVPSLVPYNLTRQSLNFSPFRSAHQTCAFNAWRPVLLQAMIDIFCIIMVSGSRAESLKHPTLKAPFI
jgi:hypothetical protein